MSITQAERKALSQSKHRMLLSNRLRRRRGCRVGVRRASNQEVVHRRYPSWGWRLKSSRLRDRRRRRQPRWRRIRPVIFQKATYLCSHRRFAEHPCVPNFALGFEKDGVGNHLSHSPCGTDRFGLRWSTRIELCHYSSTLSLQAPASS